MILNRCRGCGCPLDPGERYCEECEEERADRKAVARGAGMAAGNIEKDRKGKGENANGTNPF